MINRKTVHDLDAEELKKEYLKARNIILRIAHRLPYIANLEKFLTEITDLACSHIIDKEKKEIKEKWRINNIELKPSNQIHEMQELIKGFVYSVCEEVTSYVGNKINLNSERTINAFHTFNTFINENYARLCQSTLHDYLNPHPITKTFSSLFNKISSLSENMTPPGSETVTRAALITATAAVCGYGIFRACQPGGIPENIELAQSAAMSKIFSRK